MSNRFTRITDLKDLPASLRGGVVAIGNFDGVHRGHQSVLERAMDVARKNDVPALVLTFEPHPRSVFQPDVPLYRITPAPMRAAVLHSEGFNAVIEHPFTRDFAGLSADEFIHSVLIDGLGITHAVTGFDFHFGKNRQGGPAYLMEEGERYGFGVTLVDAFRDEGAEVVSSSRIREALAGGDVADAASLLGYRYTVEADVSRGKQLGRTLDYPTANMVLPSGNLLCHGIYAVRLRLPGGAIHDGVASFGLRPTVEDAGAPLLETHLFGFDEEIYGATCRVSFFGFLRPEEKFDSLELLKTQMKRDEEEARTLLANVIPLSRLDKAVAF